MQVPPKRSTASTASSKPEIISSVTSSGTSAETNRRSFLVGLPWQTAGTMFVCVMIVMCLSLPVWVVAMVCGLGLAVTVVIAFVCKALLDASNMESSVSKSTSADSTQPTLATAAVSANECSNSKTQEKETKSLFPWWSIGIMFAMLIMVSKIEKHRSDVSRVPRSGGIRPFQDRMPRSPLSRPDLHDGIWPLQDGKSRSPVPRSSLHDGQFETATCSVAYWQQTVAAMHQLRFGLPPNPDEPTDVYYRRRYEQMRNAMRRAQAASPNGVDSEVVAMVKRHLEIDEAEIQAYEMVLEYEAEHAIDPNSAPIDDTLAISDDLKSKLTDEQLAKVPTRVQQIMQRLWELEDLRLEQLHEIEIMQARLAERYKLALGSSQRQRFTLPELE